jgi:hypothetical protein
VVAEAPGWNDDSNGSREILETRSGDAVDLLEQSPFG